jgi:hypothetical protein
MQDPFLHHAFRPYSSGQLLWGTEHVQYDINSLGFRDLARRDVPRLAPGNRIVLIGDSFVEGVGVPYSSTVAHVLEGELAASARPSEVLNAAVASYSPFLYYRRLRRFFDAGYSATDVIAFLDISDIQDEARGGYERLGDNEFPSDSWQSAPSFIRRSQLLQQFWETFVFTSAEERDEYYAVRDRWTEEDALFEEYGRAGAERCMAQLLRLRTLAAEHGASFLLVIYPWRTQLASPRVPSRAEELFGTFARTHGIALVNAFPTFRLLDWNTYFLPLDTHWNEHGHRLMAELIAKRILAETSPAVAGTN